MAVANADLAAMKEQMEALKRLAESKSAELEQARQQIAADNRQQLQALRAQVNEKLDARDEVVRDTYQKLLERTESTLETRLQQEYRETKQRYEQVCAEVKTAYAKEQQQAEAVLVAQKQFEAAYYARQTLAHDHAEAVLREGFQALQAAVETTPIAWFLPGHPEQYRARLREMDNLMELHLFESVIGVGENLLLSLQLDLLEVEERFRRWLHYYTVLIGVLDTETDLLFVTARQVPSTFSYVCRMERLVDGHLPDDKMAYWSNDAYAALCTAHAEGCRLTEWFRVDGALPTEASVIRAYMIAHPEMAQRMQEMTLYSAAMKAVQRVADAKRQVADWQDRIAAFDERLTLGTELIRALRAYGYEWTKLSTPTQPAEPKVFRFADAQAIHALEVILVPVLRRSDDRWINLAMCFFSEEMREATISDLQHILADVLVTRQIGVHSARMKLRQTTEERVRLADADVRLQVNGRLN